MAHKDNEEPLGNEEGKRADLNQVEETRRKLMTKLVAGAFAVPTVLITLNRNAAHASIPN